MIASDQDGSAITTAPVYLYVRSPNMIVDPGSVHMIALADSDVAIAAEILVRLPQRENLTFGAIASSETWLTAVARDATIPGRVSLRANPKGLGPGLHWAVVAIETVENIPAIRIPVLLEVSAAPRLSVNPSSLAYVVPSPEMLVGTRDLHIGAVPPVEFTVDMRRGLTLQVEPMAGTTPATLRVSIQASAFDTGGAA